MPQMLMVSARYFTYSRDSSRNIARAMFRLLSREYVKYLAETISI